MLANALERQSAYVRNGRTNGDHGVYDGRLLTICTRRSRDRKTRSVKSRFWPPAAECD